MPTQLSVKGSKSVSESITTYRKRPKRKQGKAEVPFPAAISGNLWKSGRTGARFFRNEEGTPLLLYFRSRLVDKHGTAHSALDLTAATKIALISVKGEPTNKFVIQAPSPNDESSIEHVELTAPSVDEARRWVQALVDIRAYFTEGATFSPSPKKPSVLEMSQVGRDLFRRATGEGMKQSSDLANAPIASLARLSSVTSSVADGEEYFSASSDDEHPTEKEPKHEYFAAQRRLEKSIHDLANNPPPKYPASMFGRPSYEDVPIRGFNYLNDHVKITANRTLMQLALIEVFSTKKVRLDHVASHPKHRIEIARKNGTLPPFTWAIVVQVPGSSVNYLFCLYFVPSSVAIAKLFSPPGTYPEDELQEIAKSHGLPPKFVWLLQEFFFGKSDKFRNDRFKMVPQILDGPWLVKSSVPNRPALLGNKLTTRYFCNERYMELDIDVASSSIANKLTQLSVGYSKTLVVQLSFVLEGQHQDELPEEILGTASVINADMATTHVPILD